MSKASLAVSLVALVGSITSALKLSSPCPGLFHYDSTDQPNQWTGTVTVLSDVELHGVWIRLIFDGKLTGLDVGDDFEAIKKPENDNEYLIKNRDLLLEAGTPLDIKITAKYETDKAPAFSGYRLNAKTICTSENPRFGQVYPGDLDNKDFLASIKSQQASSSYKEFEGCGSAPLSTNHEPGNKKAQNGQWPWQGAIYIQNNNGEKYVCEATLVTSRHVLTPAHCVTYQKSELVVPQRQLTVYLGKYSHSRELENKETQKLGVEKVLLYPGYRSKGLLNDLAVIQLDRAVIVSDYVRPICLGQVGDGSRRFLAGYGLNEGKIGDLGQSEIGIVSEDECLERSANLKGLLTDNVLCATYVQAGSGCVGSSGTSVVSVRDGPKPIWELKGVVTVGAALQDKYVCDHSTTILLLDVANYLKWIQTVVS